MIERCYDAYTGRPVDTSAAAAAVPLAVELGLEPPRFCAHCGRRTVVQVVPDGWSSTCSRHGTIDSAALGRR